MLVRKLARGDTFIRGGHRYVVTVAADDARHDFVHRGGSQRLQRPKLLPQCGMRPPVLRIGRSCR